MTASQPRITVKAAWTDIVAANSTLASVDVLLQNLDDDVVDVVFGGASAPTSSGPVRLDTLDSVQGNAANIWVRGDGTISATVL